MLLLQQMIVLFIYMMIGYAACKKGYLDEVACSKLSWIVVNVANPMLAISAAVNGDGKIQGIELLMTFGIAMLMFGSFMVFAKILPKVLCVEEEEVAFYKLMTVFNNMGFMGFPVIAAAYGKNALLYASIFILPFNVLFYTYGIKVIDKNKSSKFEWKKVCNVGVLACIVASILYLSKMPVPQFVKSVSEGLGNLNGPLSMMVTGIAFAKIRIRDLFTDVKLIIFAMIKLLVIPILGTLFLRQFIHNEILCGVVMIIMATPVASMTLMLAKETCDNCETIVKGISLTTLLSVVTIPLVSAITSLFIL